MEKLPAGVYPSPSLFSSLRMSPFLPKCTGIFSRTVVHSPSFRVKKSKCPVDSPALAVMKRICSEFQRGDSGREFPSLERGNWQRKKRKLKRTMIDLGFWCGICLKSGENPRKFKKTRGIFCEPMGFKTHSETIGSPCWARTSDPMINSHLLYRLS